MATEEVVLFEPCDTGEVWFIVGDGALVDIGVEWDEGWCSRQCQITVTDVRELATRLLAACDKAERPDD